MTIFSQPLRIVVHMAWAIIHRLLLSVNSTSIAQYIRYCFRIVSGQCRPASVTIVHICAAHMLKAFRDNTRDKVGDLGMRKFLLRLFALMQYVILFKEAKQLWSMICTVVGSRSSTLYVEEQTTTLKELVKAASLDDLDIEETASGGK